MQSTKMFQLTEILLITSLKSTLKTNKCIHTAKLLLLLLIVSITLYFAQYVRITRHSKSNVTSFVIVTTKFQIANNRSKCMCSMALLTSPFTIYVRKMDVKMTKTWLIMKINLKITAHIIAFLYIFCHAPTEYLKYSIKYE